MKLSLHKKENSSKIGLVEEVSWRRITRDPLVDWVFVIGISFVAVIILGWVAVAEYFNMNKVISGTGNNLTTHVIQPIDLASLDKVTTAFAAKAEKSASAKTAIMPLEPR